MVLQLLVYYFIDDNLFLKYIGKDNDTVCFMGTVAGAGTFGFLIVVIVILVIKYVHQTSLNFYTLTFLFSTIVITLTIKNTSCKL